MTTTEKKNYLATNNYTHSEDILNELGQACANYGYGTYLEVQNFVDNYYEELVNGNYSVYDIVSDIVFYDTLTMEDVRNFAQNYTEDFLNAYEITDKDDDYLSRCYHAIRIVKQDMANDWVSKNAGLIVLVLAQNIINDMGEDYIPFCPNLAQDLIYESNAETGDNYLSYIYDMIQENVIEPELMNDSTCGETRI